MLVAAVLFLAAPPAQSPSPPISLTTLVKELEDMDALARFPDPPYRALCATSFNRASVAKDKPGWFADSDGAGFLREETNGERHEWVIQEQQGPGCITRIWTPYFYNDLADHVGPNVRIYLDGASEPLFALPLIELVTQNEWKPVYGAEPPRQGKLDIPYLFGGFTARAGCSYLPIPFAKGCKVTLDKPPFYYSIDSRAYPPGTRVESATLPKLLAEIEYRLSASCTAPVEEGEPQWRSRATLAGPAALRSLDVRVDPAEIRKDPGLLRRLVLRASFDGEPCIWCPLGDFFGGPNALQSVFTRARSATLGGELHCAWRMPFEKSAEIELLELGGSGPHAQLSVRTGPWTWDARSMHFHASWRPDETVAGDHFEDWNFVDVSGEGVFVGDQWTVLNLTDGWWGEGDAKIYVDADVARGFPGQFGTGTEDYYGWAGGVNPKRADIFMQPWQANISVGSTDHDSTRGFNILARDRALDAIPFRERFVFDMEASPGTEQRRPSDRLGYSSVAFWYAKPGAKSNRGAAPEAAQKPLMSLEALEKAAQARR